MKNKKKNSQNGSTLFNIVTPSAFIKPSIFDFDTNTCNGVPISNLEDNLNKLYTQPPGIRATCHGHPEPLGFKSIADLQKHWQEEHEGRQK
jgi:hypothetical protein